MNIIEVIDNITKSLSFPLVFGKYLPFRADNARTRLLFIEKYLVKFYESLF